MELEDSEDYYTKKARKSIIEYFARDGVILPQGENPLVYIQKKKEVVGFKTYYLEYILAYIDGVRKILFSPNPKTSEVNPWYIYWTLRRIHANYEDKYGMEKTLTTNILDSISTEAKDEMEHIWFTADLHHGHDKIVNICDRPTTIENHTNWLINEVWNKYIGKNDLVYILGDLSLATRKEAEKFIQVLRGRKFLILGNHDSNIRNSNHFVQITQKKDFNFSRFGLNIHIALDHYPHVSWNRSIHGSWHLYGHVHGRYKHPGMAMDVGIDNSDFEGYRPLNLYQICEFMDQKEKVIKEQKSKLISQDI